MLLRHQFSACFAHVQCRGHCGVKKPLRVIILNYSTKSCHLVAFCVRLHSKLNGNDWEKAIFSTSSLQRIYLPTNKNNAFKLSKLTQDVSTGEIALIDRSLSVNVSKPYLPNRNDRSFLSKQTVCKLRKLGQTKREVQSRVQFWSRLL